MSHVYDAQLDGLEENKILRQNAAGEYIYILIFTAPSWLLEKKKSRTVQVHQAKGEI